MASIAYLDVVIGGLVTVIVAIAVPLLLHPTRAAGAKCGARCLPAISLCSATADLSKALGLLLPTMLLLIGNQGMYQKFFSARSEKDAQYRGRRMDRRDGVSGNDADDVRGDRELDV